MMHQEPQSFPKGEVMFKAAEAGDPSVFNNLTEDQMFKVSSLRNEDDRSVLHVDASSGRVECYIRESEYIGDNDRHKIVGLRWYVMYPKGIFMVERALPKVVQHYGNEVSIMSNTLIEDLAFPRPLKAPARLDFGDSVSVKMVGLAWAAGSSPIVWLDGMVGSDCLFEETGSGRQCISGAWLHQFGPFGGLPTLDLFTVKDDSTGVDNFA
ncbi:hypothetical protein QQ045_019844 [Rhodiola kirilowii]